MGSYVLGVLISLGIGLILGLEREYNKLKEEKGFAGIWTFSPCYYLGVFLGYPKRVAFFIPVMVTLSVSGLYEIIEWLVADIFFVEQGISYLGTQGDVWDAQKDTSMALIGTLMASTVFMIQHKLKSDNPDVGHLSDRNT